MINTFKELFDIVKFKRVLRIIVLFVLLVVAINTVGIAYSRYESDIEVETAAKVAYFITDAETQNHSISLSGLLPSSDPYIYKIDVTNYDKYGNKSNVDYKYKMEFKTTTNLPLELHLLRNEEFSSNYHDIITSHYIETDSQMPWHKYEINHEYTFTHNSKQKDEYTLVVYFPLQYQNNPTDYQGVIDLIELTITSEQLV